MTAVEPATCPSWCTITDHRTDRMAADRNCWGPDHEVILHLEKGAPGPDFSREEQLEMDPPRINPFAYQTWHGLPVVYLHLYRPHENEYLDIDNSLMLTPGEAVQLAEGSAGCGR